MAKPSHEYKLLDQVWYEADNCPFVVVGVRLDWVEIHGDFSGGTHNVAQSDWVPADRVEPWQTGFLGVHRQLHDATPGTAPNMYRYVAAGTPSLLADFERFVGREEKWYVAQVLNRRPNTIRQMLRHERPLWILDFMKLCSVLGLSIDEAQARYWANAPAEKIAEQQAVENNISQLNMMAEVRKLLAPKP